MIYYDIRNLIYIQNFTISQNSRIRFIIQILNWNRLILI